MIKARSDAVTAIILAGGTSQRLGQDKRRLRLWGAAGPTLLEHTIGLVSTFCPEVIVVLNDTAAWPTLPVRRVADCYSDGGPLGAMYSGLLAVTTEYALTLACDMPLLVPALLEAMLAHPRDYDVLVPRSTTPGTTRNHLGVEPLHAIYGRRCLAPIWQALEVGQRRITDFFPQVRIAYVEPDELRQYDPTGHGLLSINTPAQLAKVRHILANGIAL